MRNFLLMLMIGCLATAAFAAESKNTAPKPKSYTIKYAKEKPDFTGDWDAYWNSPAWKQAGTANVDVWTTTSKAQPKTQAKMLYDETGVRIIWRVEDNFVIARAKKFDEPVFREATVEFFFEPSKEKDYANIEINAGGSFVFHVQRPAPGEDVKVKYPPKYKRPAEVVPADVSSKIQVRKSMKDSVIDPPITEPTVWYVEMFIPIDVLDTVFGIKAADLSGSSWRGNIYKIMEGTKGDPESAKHVHYGQWTKVAPPINFHQPAKFGTLRFEKAPAKQ